MATETTRTAAQTGEVAPATVNGPPTRPAGRVFAGADRRAPLRDALARWGHWGPGQTAGRFYPMACVSLEVTQRCNLDCTLCYLSDEAESAHDAPLSVLLDRVAMLHSHYGPGVSIQLSGGDPTLRKIEDLEALCRRIRSLGMRSCLMTNGIKATRSFLVRLAAAGLDDVAFHVDLTQERRGFSTEVSLNPVRRSYLNRARGAGLRVLFNTTVYDGNLAELPALAAWFRAHADEIALASFQLQADTGRGVLRAREDTVSQASVMRRLEQGFGTQIDFDVAAVGHPDCNRYGNLLVSGEVAVSALDDRALAEAVIPALSRYERRRDAHLDIAATALRVAARRPDLAARMLWHGARLLWRLRAGLWASGGRVSRLAVLVHNFMDASALQKDRCESCVFMVATEEGPLSMCVHNAERDKHVFAPAQVREDEGCGVKWWSAATGAVTDAPDRAAPAPPPLKRLKGRRRSDAQGAA